MRAIIIGLCIGLLALAQQPRPRMDRKTVEKLERMAERLERQNQPKPAASKDDEQAILQERLSAVSEKLRQLATDKSKPLDARDEAARLLLSIEGKELPVKDSPAELAPKR